MSTVTDVEEWLSAAPSVHNLRYELDQLRGIREWALNQLGIDYREGDPVTLTQDIACGTDYHHGWWKYRECLVKGALGWVQAINFWEGEGKWYADVVLDRAWEVHHVGTAAREVRYWRGPDSTAPEGFTPTKNHLSGSFSLPAKSLAKAEAFTDDYKAARGVVGGTEPAEVIIRRGRGDA